MSRELPEQKNIFPDVAPEHKRSFDFIIEDETEEDRRLGVQRIRDGGDVYKFSLTDDGEVRCHGDMKRLTRQKIMSIMGLAFAILNERKNRREASEKSGLLF